MSSSAVAATSRRRRAAVWITIGIVIALIIAFFVFSSLYTDVLWFNQVGYLNVLTTQWAATVSLFFIGFFGMAFPLWLSIQLGYRLRPVYAKLNTQLDRYQQVVEPLRRLAMYGIPIIFGLFAGFSASSRWQTVLAWMHATRTGTTDPLFHLDNSFYLFDLPFFRGVVAFASASIIVAFIGAAATTYLYGSVRVSGREVRISRAARTQIALTAALYFLVQAISIWLDRYATVTDSNVNGMINGAAYTDVHATIPARAVLAGAAVVVGLLFVVTAFIGRWRFPLIATLLLIVSAIVVGAIFPWIVQKFEVEPSQKTLEAPYIQRSITQTRDAFGLSNIETIGYNAKTDAQPGALQKDATTAAQIRIIDPSQVSKTFGQLQQFRQYYSFPDNLAVDRYQIDGQEQDVVIAARELTQSGLGAARNWYNDTIVYTHGYGVVAAYGNRRNTDGTPVFLEKGLPTTGSLGHYEQAIYFGQDSPRYSIVGAPQGSKPVELDYPGGSGNTQQTYSTFKGDGGPKLDSFFKRLVYAIKFQDQQVVLSDAVNNSSQILYNRNPVSRVQQVAPYLTLDSNVYPAVVNGRVVWIVDGYTTSDDYPYSKSISLSGASADTDTPRPAYAFDDINYIRNSVKATVDAYSGKVTLYSWDANDPILKTWEKVYPGTVKPLKDMSGALISHVRYPENLFKVQRSILGQYHVTDPGAFYSREDAWTTPNDPVSPAANPTTQPPYYLSLKMPGQTKSTFSLYTTFIPQATSQQSRSILKGYLAVDADAGSTAGTRASDYGRLRLLELPQSSNVAGPGLVENQFQSDTTVSKSLNLLRQGSTKVIQGNLLTLPVGGGFLYVQPVYIQSTGETSYPLLQNVLVSFGSKIAFEDTLDDALNTLFGGNSGVTVGDSSANGGGSPTPTGTGGTGSTTVSPALAAALQQAQQAIVAKENALKAGDWTAYGEADQQLTNAINAAVQAEQGSSSSSSSSSSRSTPKPTATATPSG